MKFSYVISIKGHQYWESQRKKLKGEMIVQQNGKMKRKHLLQKHQIVLAMGCAHLLIVTNVYKPQFAQLEKSLTV